MKLYTRLAVLLVCTTLVFGISRRKDEEVSDECKDLLEKPEIDDDKMTREELVCIYWSSGGSQKDAEKKADKSIQEGDENGNGVIDGDEKI
ncbi:Hypothetical predicted protein [Mytilus galloprovincialis]|uniref:EF-hand domain-containing protein n=1 Tax=Mytilus galloprovincialis TaxID=29158 RepID=A0A8B6ENU3_MYTGA|nr:Hypothetical predicted protein [Mytilus galloprovincialis]